MASGGDQGGVDNGGGAVEETMIRMKFLCSHGGRILPRPTDGQLKYVGGETRVVAVPRDISFSELMKKLTAWFEKDIVLKYQVIPEGLEALVSVRSDEDLKLMLDEHDRHESEGTPRLRAFLFSSNPIVVETQATSIEAPALEQRYVDAINGINRSPAHSRLTPINANHVSRRISSACSTPRCLSPKAQAADPTSADVFGYQNGRVRVHRVQSSPNLFALNGPANHHFYPQPYFQSPQLHHQHGYIPQQTVGNEKLAPCPSWGRAEKGPSLMGYGRNSFGRSTTSSYRDSGGCNKCWYYNEGGFYVCDGVDRSGSLRRSPR